MEAYEGFAAVYDLFMEETNYAQWVVYLEKIWLKYNISPKLILDLGCGTGNISLPLAKKGYEVIGIDVSEDMLSVAKEKAERDRLDILFLMQDMREFELYGTVDCVISLYDSLNYITEEEDLLQVFCLVNNYLDPGGLFIFDMNTEYKFQNKLADRSFAETTEKAAYIWENYYDEKEKINEFYMNFFVKEENSEQYKRFEEYHYERAYDIEKIKELITKSGMELLNVFDAFTFEEAREDSERIYFVAKEIQK